MGRFDDDSEQRSEISEWMSGRGSVLLVVLVAAIVVVGILVFTGIF